MRRLLSAVRMRWIFLQRPTQVQSRDRSHCDALLGAPASNGPHNDLSKFPWADGPFAIVDDVKIVTQLTANFANFWQVFPIASLRAEGFVDQQAITLQHVRNAREEARRNEVHDDSALKRAGSKGEMFGGIAKD
jgi:hypothetical protein